MKLTYQLFIIACNAKHFYVLVFVLIHQIDFTAESVSSKFAVLMSSVELMLYNYFWLLSLIIIK